jgi:hypothetical protein
MQKLLLLNSKQAPACTVMYHFNKILGMNTDLLISASFLGEWDWNSLVTRYLHSTKDNSAAASLADSLAKPSAAKGKNRSSFSRRTPAVRTSCPRGCGKTFSRPSDAARHERTAINCVYGKYVARVPCSICGNLISARTDAVIRHQRTAHQLEHKESDVDPSYGGPCYRNTWRV